MAFVVHGSPSVSGEWQGRVSEILDGIVDGIVIAGDDCRIQYANRAAGQIFGIASDQLVGRRCDDPALGLSATDGSLRPEEQLACCRELKPGETPPQVEQAVRRVDGSTVAVMTRTAPLHDPQSGRFLGTLNSYADITERKNAEDALRDSEERYRRFVETSQEGVWAQDAEFRTTFVNDELGRMLGYRPEDMIGRPVLEFIYDEDVAAFREQMTHRRRGEPNRYEMRLRRADGSPIWFKLSATPVTDRSGAFAGSFAMFTDITENKEAERAVRESEERYRSLVEASPDAIAVYQRGIVIFANPAAGQVFGGPGHSSDELIGRQVIDFVHPDSREVVSQRMLQMQQERKPLLPIEEKYVRLDGHEMIVELAAIPFVWEGDPSVQIVARDVTERKQAQEQLQALNAELEQRVEERTSELVQANEELRKTNEEVTRRNDAVAEMNSRLDEATRAKSDFLAGMSHELRTPLNSILGFSSILLQGLAGPVNGEQEKQLTMVNNAGKHLLGLINQILDLSKVEAGELHLALTEFDVADVLDRVCDTIAPLVAEKSLTFECGRPSERISMRSDSMRVGQVLINLLGNAVKFTDHGGISLRTRRDGHAVVFEISDTGGGISEADLAMIFDEFYQVAPLGIEKVAGTGLGLAISKRLVELLCGSIDVRSAVGSGSTFTVRLPIREDVPAATQPRATTSD